MASEALGNAAAPTTDEYALQRITHLGDYDVRARPSAGGPAAGVLTHVPAVLPAIQARVT